MDGLKKELSHLLQTYGVQNVLIGLSDSLLDFVDEDDALILVHNKIRNAYQILQRRATADDDGA